MDGDVSDHPYQTQFEAFFTALGKNEPMPLTSLADAVRSFDEHCVRGIEANRERCTELLIARKLDVVTAAMARLP